jgi:NAD(P)-dependent dehydrogenase (short-subunit alcohol dehydrogenase family)
MIIITGISGGIGKFIGQQFSVINEEEIVGIYNIEKPEPSDLTRRINFIQGDLANEADVENLIKQLGENAMEIKLIHCAGVTKNGMSHKTSFSDWQKVISANLDSAFLLAKHLLPIMREQLYGKIIFLSSVVPQIGVMGTAGYSSAKAGLWGLMKTLAKENATKNITVNTLNLGYFNIGMIKEVPQEALKEIIAAIPCKKLGDPVDIFSAIKFIFESTYMTGTSININGGLY